MWHDKNAKAIVRQLLHNVCYASPKMSAEEGSVMKVNYLCVTWVNHAGYFSLSKT